MSRPFDPRFDAAGTPPLSKMSSHGSRSLPRSGVKYEDTPLAAAVSHGHWGLLKVLLGGAAGRLVTEVVLTLGRAERKKLVKCMTIEPTLLGSKLGPEGGRALSEALAAGWPDWVPDEARVVVTECIHVDPTKRPSARAVALRLHGAASGGAA